MSKTGFVICLSDGESSLREVTAGVDSVDAVQKYLRGHHTAVSSHERRACLNAHYDYL